MDDVARPEDPPTADGQQRRKQGEPRPQHQGDADRERRTHALVQPELGQSDTRQSGDDGERRERDRLADPSDRTDDGVWPG